ncbi:MAG: hypothetical protein IIZ48_06325, partial [Erysipelotrichales bacterium]|nr:hypothetical protein [Erysipelotrichales bacterium]
LFSFFFEYAIIHRDYGLHCLNASASVLSFIKMPIKTSIAGVLVITNIIRIALAEFYTMMIMKVCGKVQRLIPSVSLMTVITVFPCILFYLLN